MNRTARIFISLIVLGSSLFTLTACDLIQNSIRGSGDLVSVEMSFSGINGVSLTTQGEMVIGIGAEEKLIIEAQENLQPYIEANLANGKLTIETREGYNLNPTKAIRYLLTVKSIEFLTVTSSGSINAPALEVDQFQVKITSSGDINLESLIAETLDVSLTSSGDLEIAAGQVESQEVHISSSGNYIAGDLRSQEAEVDITSSGDVTVWVTDRLEVNISSSGDVSYYGSPEVNTKITSSGRVNQLGDKE